MSQIKDFNIIRSNFGFNRFEKIIVSFDELFDFRFNNPLAIGILRVSVEIILVILFSRIELLNWLHFSHNAIVVSLGVFQLVDEPFGDRFLFVVVVEDHRTILSTNVFVVLTVQQRWIVEEEEYGEDSFGADYSRIIFDLNHFGVICCSRFYLRLI